MALRSARRKNLFLNTLKQQTYAYINEQNKAFKEQLRKIVVNTKDVVKNVTKRSFSSLKQGDVVRFYHKGKQVKEGDSNFGKVYTHIETLPATITRNLNVVMKDYANKVFAMSQKLVPVDKRYAFVNKADKTSVYVKSYRDRSIISVSDYTALMDKEEVGLKSFRRAVEYGFRDKEKGITSKERTFLNAFGIDVGVVGVRAGYGWYEGKEADFIRKYLSGTNTRTHQYGLLYDQKTNKLYSRSPRNSIEFNEVMGISLNLEGKKKSIYKDKVINVKKQPTGGYQELKSGGKLRKVGDSYIITYSAFDETRPAGDRYNYAALQHDNLAFKHKFGQSLYLSDAVSFYKAKLLKQAREAAIKAGNRSRY